MKPVIMTGWSKLAPKRHIFRHTFMTFHIRWCPKKYAASNVPVIDIEKTDGKCLEVIKHLLGKAAGFTHRAAYPVAQAAVITLNADGIYLPHLMFIILKGLKKRRPVV